MPRLLILAWLGSVASSFPHRIGAAGAGRGATPESPGIQSTTRTGENTLCIDSIDTH